MSTPAQQQDTKYIGAYVDGEKHEAFRLRAKANHRTISDHLRYLVDRDLSVPLEESKVKEAAK